MSRIRKVFESLKGEGALIAYVMGGDPDIGTTEKVVDALVAGGADIIELGIPFSDPIADGKSIQESAVRALAARTRPGDVLSAVSRIRRRQDVPIAIMTYYNIVYSPGIERFLEEARSASVDGLIIPDLPLDETAEYSRLARAKGLDTILLAAPTTSPERMRSLVGHTSGFLYLVSIRGVTGARSALGVETLSLVRDAARQTRGRIPLAVGFGISKPEHVRAVLAAGADGAIVGSSIVNRVASGKPQREMLKEIENYVRSLKGATKPSR